MVKALNKDIVNHRLKNIDSSLSTVCTKYLAGANAKSTFFCGKHFFEATIGGVVRSFKNGNNGCGDCYRLDIVLNKDIVNDRLKNIDSSISTVCTKYLSGLNAKSTFFCGKHFFEAEAGHVLRSFKKGNNGCGKCARSKRYLNKVIVNSRLKNTDPSISTVCTKYLTGKNAKSTFFCGKHSFEATVDGVLRSFKKGNNGCPYCCSIASGCDR